MKEQLYTTTNAIIVHALHLLQDESLDDRQHGFMLTILDNAEKFIYIAAEYQDAPLEKISSEMRHNLGNPLTPINGYSELMATGLLGTLNEDQQHHIETIWNLTSDLKVMVDDIVQEARIRTAEMAAAS